MGNTEASPRKLYKDRFMVSSDGKVEDLKGGRGLSTLNGAGYVRLTTGDLLHRVVYTLFKGEIPHKFAINHKDGVKTNNNVENLEALSYSDNQKHSYRVLGGKSYLLVRKLTDDDVFLIVKALRETKEPMTEIAKRYGVSPVAIQLINSGDNYSRLTCGSCNDYPIRSKGQETLKRGTP